VKAERFGVDDILDEIAKSLAAVEFGAAAPLPKGPNCIAPFFLPEINSPSRLRERQFL
jgi:hypothetical protein